MISPETLQAVASAVQEAGCTDEAIRGLRERLGIPLTLCRDDDVIAAKPAFAGREFNLYYVDGSGHCWSLTNDGLCATGVLVATIED